MFLDHILTRDVFSFIFFCILEILHNSMSLPNICFQRISAHASNSHVGVFLHHINCVNQPYFPWRSSFKSWPAYLWANIILKTASPWLREPENSFSTHTDEPADPSVTLSIHLMTIFKILRSCHRTPWRWFWSSRVCNLHALLTLPSAMIDVMPQNVNRTVSQGVHWKTAWHLSQETDFHQW